MTRPGPVGSFFHDKEVHLCALRVSVAHFQKRVLPSDAVFHFGMRGTSAPQKTATSFAARHETTPPASQKPDHQSFHVGVHKLKVETVSTFKKIPLKNPCLSVSICG
jgi:hypothetical protein